jgi:glycosyltransferase involved in cell wall biosynthesis
MRKAHAIGKDLPPSEMSGSEDYTQNLMNTRRPSHAFLERMRLLARYHWGRLWFRLKVILSIRTLLRNPREYFQNLLWHLTKSLRDSPHSKFGVLRQYEPKEPSIENFPRLRAAAEQLPRLALVTPSYNQGQYLEATIQSVLSQNYPNLEYAVVDGGSTDESPRIIGRYRDQLAYAVSEKDAGQADGIIKGFARTSGEIMAYLNADDLLEPGTLRFVGEFFRRHPNVDAIYGHRLVINENGMEVGRWVSPRYNAKVLRLVDYIPQETLFWRRSLYEDVDGIDRHSQFAMDWDLLLRFASAGARIKRVPYFLGRFRVHVAQKTAALIDSTGAREIDSLHMRELGFRPDEGVLEACRERLKFHYPTDIVGGAALGIITSAIVWYVSKLDFCERLLKHLFGLLAQWRVAAKIEDAA